MTFYELALMYALIGAIIFLCGMIADQMVIRYKMKGRNLDHHVIYIGDTLGEGGLNDIDLDYQPHIAEMLGEIRNRPWECYIDGSYIYTPNYKIDFDTSSMNRVYFVRVKEDRTTYYRGNLNDYEKKAIIAMKDALIRYQRNRILSNSKTFNPEEIVLEMEESLRIREASKIHV
jgi:hypothetical protein